MCSTDVELSEASSGIPDRFHRTELFRDRQFLSASLLVLSFSLSPSFSIDDPPLYILFRDSSIVMHRRLFLGWLFRGLIDEGFERVIDIGSPERKLYTILFTFYHKFSTRNCPAAYNIFYLRTDFSLAWKYLREPQDTAIHEITLYSNVIMKLFPRGVSCLYFKVNDDHTICNVVMLSREK